MAITFSPDRAAYNVGDVAVITITASGGELALVLKDLIDLVLEISSGWKILDSPTVSVVTPVRLTGGVLARTGDPATLTYTATVSS